MECMRAFREEWGSCVEDGFKDFDRMLIDAIDSLEHAPIDLTFSS